jgi:D-tyrosyl-tRNA(Tyr) deacylase
VRIVVQRVSRASVDVDGVVVGSIDAGFLLLVGIEPSDTEDDILRAGEKVANLRVFPDEAGQMNRSLVETGGSALVVSQFTLLADIRKGRRPSFVGAAPPELAEPMVDRFVEVLRNTGTHVETGVFGASMDVELVNSGPVTLVLEIRDGRVT